MKSQNGVVENYVFRPQNFWGEGPPKSDADILGPNRVTSGRKVCRNSPTDPDDIYQSTPDFWPIFSISGVKKLLGADPSPVRCALASVGHPPSTNCEKLRIAKIH